MSLTTDDAFVRRLSHRLDAEAPEMSLAPAAVLAAGRRRRRRLRAATGAGGTVAAALAVVGGLTLVQDAENGVDAASAERVALGSSLVMQVARDARPLDPTDPSLLDTGIYFETDRTGPDDLRFVLEPADDTLELRLGAPGGVGESLGTAHLTAAEGLPVTSWVRENWAVTVGAVPAGAEVESLLLHVRGQEPIEVPTFDVPGVAGEVFVVGMHDPEETAMQWPNSEVVLTTTDGRTLPGNLMVGTLAGFEDHAGWAAPPSSPETLPDAALATRLMPASAPHAYELGITREGKGTYALVPSADGDSADLVVVRAPDDVETLGTVDLRPGRQDDAETALLSTIEVDEGTVVAVGSVDVGADAEPALRVGEERHRLLPTPLTVPGLDEQLWVAVLRNDFAPRDEWGPVEFEAAPAGSRPTVNVITED